MSASKELFSNYCKYSRFFHYLNINFDRNQFNVKNETSTGSFTKINVSAMKHFPDAILKNSHEMAFGGALPGSIVNGTENYQEISDLYANYLLNENNNLNIITETDRILIQEVLKSLLELVIQFNKSKYNEYNDLCHHIQRYYMVNIFLDKLNYLNNSSNTLSNNAIVIFNELSGNDTLIYGQELFYTAQYLGLNISETNFSVMPAQSNPLDGSFNPDIDFWNFIISLIPSLNILRLFNEALSGNEAAQSQLRIIWQQANRQILIDASRASSKASIIFLVVGTPSAAGVASRISTIANILLIIDDILNENYENVIFDIAIFNYLTL